LKRSIDLILSIIALIILSPILLVITILIKLDSQGPVIFKQQRVGISNRLFTIYKFRTMKIDTPDIPTHLLCNPGIYITRLGKLLRKTSLDELPQIINILRGDMSIVGPRPALHNQYQLMEMRSRMGIDIIQPGLTGWAQVNGRDDISDERKAELDYHYLQHRSLWFDTIIILRTFVSAFSTKGVKS